MIKALTKFLTAQNFQDLITLAVNIMPTTGGLASKS